MSENQTSSTIPVKVNVVDKNRKINLEFKESLNSTIYSHDSKEASHPYILSRIAEVNTALGARTSVLEQTSQELNTKDAELEALIQVIKNGNVDLPFDVAAPQVSSNAVNKGYLEAYIGNGFSSKANCNLDNITSQAASNLNTAGVKTVVESYYNATSWYRIWSDGWIEQGGKIDNSSGMISFVKVFSVIPLGILITPYRSDNSVIISSSLGNLTSSSFTYIATSTYTAGIYWKACGY